MIQYYTFFLAGLSFVMGCVLAGAGLNFFIIFLLSVLIAGFLIIKKIFSKTIILLSVSFLLFGFIYYLFDDFSFYQLKNSIKKAEQFEGVVVDATRQNVSNQTVEVELLEAKNEEDDLLLVQYWFKNSSVFVVLDKFEKVEYGDRLSFSGRLVLPSDDSYGTFMSKEGILGTVFYPEFTVGENVGHFFFRALHNFRSQIKEKIGFLFNQKRGAFLTGVLLGDRSEFSEEFLNKLSLSGVMHLTALSGLHVAIIVFILVSIFSFIFFGNKKLTFWFSFLFVFLFVALTGFKVSAIRASSMAFLVSLAEQNGRIYNPPNALVFSALLICLFNPKAPVFDVGFQLSFLATIGIIYLTPVIKRISFFQKSGFLAWREVLALSLSAQLSVIPITILYFSNFSISALPANVLILIIMPVLMVFGFMTVLSTFFYSGLASLLVWPTSFLLDYAIYITELFYNWRLPFNPSVSLLFIFIYYLIFFWVCFKWSYPLREFLNIDQDKIKF